MTFHSFFLSRSLVSWGVIFQSHGPIVNRKRVWLHCRIVFASTKQAKLIAKSKSSIQLCNDLQNLSLYKSPQLSWVEHSCLKTTLISKPPNSVELSTTCLKTSIMDTCINTPFCLTEVDEVPPMISGENLLLTQVRNIYIYTFKTKL